MDSDLTQGEREFMEIYRHYKATEGHTLMPQHISAVGPRLMSPPSYHSVNEIANALLERGFITANLGLTKSGEDYLYPQQTTAGLTQGEAEFMKIYRHYNALEGHVLMPQHISAMGPKLMTPPNYRRANEIAQGLADKGYITDELGLTAKGQAYLYGP